MFVIAAKSSRIATKTRPATQNEAGLTRAGRGEADYAIVRPTDAADDDDVSDDDVTNVYDYPAAAAVRDDVKTSRREYLELVADDQPLRLLAVLSRHEADADETAGCDDADDDITNQQQTTTAAARHSDATRDPATEQPAAYVEII